MSFITFEGPEGAGKSTQIARLHAALKAAGRDVVLTREPGGAPEAEKLRSLLLDPASTFSPLSEALLMNAARDAHVRAVIDPALRSGRIVLCDRFCDSTRAYQSAVDDGFLLTLQRAVAPRMPDVTILLDVPVAAGLARAAERGAADRFEQKGRAYHEEVRRRFLALAHDEPGRIAVIDGTGAPDLVGEAVREALHERVPGLLSGVHG